MKTIWSLLLIIRNVTIEKSLRLALEILKRSDSKLNYANKLVIELKDRRAVQYTGYSMFVLNKGLVLNFHGGLLKFSVTFTHFP